MVHNRLLAWALMICLLLSLLLVPAVLARSGDRTSAGQGVALPPMAPGDPIINPISNTHTAPATTSVSISYDEPINPAAVSTGTFAVHAAQTGLLTQTYHVSGGTISLTPLQPFKPGELVQVSATTGTLNLSGEGPISPTVWSFRAAASGGYAHFARSGQTFPLSNTTALALGDLNADGHLDAFAMDWTGQVNQILLNDGTGTFVDSGQDLGDIQSTCAAMGDVDGDGDLDLWVGNAFDTEMDEIWLNDGRGFFTKSGQATSSSSNGGLALGDLDGDGDLDAFVGRTFGADQVWINDGRGIFTDSNQTLDGPNTYAIALGDLDGDSDLDAFVAAGGLFNADPNQVWLNDGRGVFTKTYPGLGSSRSTAVALGDLNGDGALDAFVANTGFYNEMGQANEVWLNDGGGQFTDSGQRLGNAHSWAVELGDLDGDGDLDAFVANGGVYDDQPNTVWLNDGGGLFRGMQALGHVA
jgi:hypothetical protein